ncbi:hypothetical protein IWX90DRAFT_474356 [Phyllosticta citrichinensis]|uniref:F-box domain-containing protein n=1 Tax=Phyllosticta citrichinensis TaxID=1130410 RepID=A0ABR1Y7M0_9PEZI
MAGIADRSKLEELPGELLLRITEEVGRISQIYLDPGQDSLVSFHVTSQRLRDMSRRLLFRGFVVDWDDLINSSGKHRGLFPSNNSLQAFQGVPEKVKWTRSFAFKAGRETRVKGVPVTKQSIERTGLFLSHMLSTATELSKLTVLLLIAAKDFSLHNVMRVHGIPALPFVKELAIDLHSGFLLESCPEVTSVTIMGCSRHGSFYNASNNLLARIANMEKVETVEHNSTFDETLLPFPTMSNVRHYKVVGALISHHWMRHYADFATCLPSTMPNLVSLTIVIHAHEHAPSRAWKKLGKERIARHFTAGFLREHPKLQKVTIARILYRDQHMHYPELVDGWERQRGHGKLEDSPLYKRNELSFGGISYKEWTPTSEGLP